MWSNVRAARPALVALVVVAGAAAGAALATRGSPAAEHAPPSLAGRSFAGDLDGQRAEIRLDENHGGTATGGCNTFGLVWRLEGTRLVARVTTSTMMLCDVADSRVDVALEQLLESHPRVELRGSTLIVWSGSRVWRGDEVPTPR
jgi:heat shock protein HslJ